MWGSIVPFDTLEGKTLTNIEVADDVMRFTCDDGEVFELYHDQDCCENVGLEDVVGELSDLIGSPVLSAQEVDGSNEPPEGNPEWVESYTWTFYHLRTMKGTVTLRWYGESNGYYSESVDLHRVTN